MPKGDLVFRQPPGTTDDAICPWCGQRIKLIRFSPGVRDVICGRCQKQFDVFVTIVVSSPSFTPPIGEVPHVEG